jgi:CBS domain-containing protein
VAVAAGPQLIFGNFGEGLARLSPLATLLLWLGPINILLGLFNLIPGFPLDGGRVLRSMLWALTDDLRRATRWASRVGQIVAWLFIINGIAMAFGARLPLFGSGFLSGLWLVFIGLFLNSAAVQSYRQVAIEDLFEGVPVAHLMRPNVPTVSPDLRINQLVDNYVMTTEEQAFPVVENDRLVGLVSVEDINRVPREVWPTWPVSQIMTPADDIDVVTPRDDVTEAFHKLARRDVRQMPVVQDGHLVGILRHRDIVRWLHLRSGFAAR